MRFRVTSVTSGPVGTAVAPVTVTLEDWLNAALADGDFGDGLQQLTFVVVGVDDDPRENARWVMAHDKLGSFRHPNSGVSMRYLSLALPLSPSLMVNSSHRALLEQVSRAVIKRLTQRPKRLPRNFDFVRCSAAVRAALNAYVPQAA